MLLALTAYRMFYPSRILISVIISDGHNCQSFYIKGVKLNDFITP